MTRRGGGVLLLAAVGVVVLLVADVAARPDSAGVVPLPLGLAYGGIPYGSVTGMIAEYERKYGKINHNYGQANSDPLYDQQQNIAGNIL